MLDLECVERTDTTQYLGRGAEVKGFLIQHQFA